MAELRRTGGGDEPSTDPARDPSSPRGVPKEAKGDRKPKFSDSLLKYLAITHHLLWTLIGIAVLIGALVLVRVGPQVIEDIRTDITGEQSGDAGGGSGPSDAGDSTAGDSAQADLDRALSDYGDVAGDVLIGRIPAPKGFDRCVTRSLSRERLAELRSGESGWNGPEADAAALCLLELGVPPESLR